MGKSSWEKQSDKEKLNRINKFKANMKGKNKGKKVLRHPKTLNIISVFPNEVQKYKDIGYIEYSRNKDKKLMINLKTFKKEYVDPKDFEKYLKLGFIFSDKKFKI